MLCCQLVVSSWDSGQMLQASDMGVTPTPSLGQICRFYLCQSARSKFSRSWSRKTLLSLHDGLSSQSDCTGVKPATSGLICNQSCRKFQFRWLKITANTKNLYFEYVFFLFSISAATTNISSCTSNMVQYIIFKSGILEMNTFNVALWAKCISQYTYIQ